jgi:hypothetical protein
VRGEAIAHLEVKQLMKDLMKNRIRLLEVQDHSLIPAEAELRVRVVPDYVGPGIEVRGRLMGPTCRFSTTVEVAYHLRPVPGAELLWRVIIPEASLWEPECPFLYQGPVELWQEGQRCDRRIIRRGLRSLALGGSGLRVNGRSLTLRGALVQELTEEQALRWRQTGHNLLLAPVEKEEIWEMADRLGFLVLGRLGGAAVSGQILSDRAGHPSCLGWLAAPGQAIPEGLPAGTWAGSEVDAAHREAAPGASFVAGPPEVLPWGEGPYLLWAPAGTRPPGPGGLLGWVEPGNSGE